MRELVNDEHHFHRFDTQTGGAVATEELEEDAVATMTQVVQLLMLFLHQHIVMMPAARGVPRFGQETQEK